MGSFLFPGILNFFAYLGNIEPIQLLTERHLMSDTNRSISFPTRRQVKNDSIRINFSHEDGQTVAVKMATLYTDGTLKIVVDDTETYYPATSYFSVVFPTRTANPDTKRPRAVIA